MEMEVEAVYYISAQGQVTRVIDDLVRPNGIAVALDGRSLYVADNGADRLHCYPIKEPGHLGPRRWTARVTFPDGMTVDRAGRLYVACLDGIWVLDQKGKWVGRIDTPQQPANCTFGGDDDKTLFITAQTGLYEIDTQTRGWHVHLDGATGDDRK
jgi:gluconolactonase